MFLRVLGRYYKQPWEEVAAGTWGVDYSNDLKTGETITSATITVTDSDGNDVTASLTSGSVQISDGSKVSIKFVGGTSGEIYKVTVRAISDGGSKYEAEFEIVVREV